MSTIRVRNIQNLDSTNILIPTGAVMWFASSTAPSGWLKCNGASLSTYSYPNLFNVIGFAYGYVNATTFSLPDLRGEVIRGWDDSRGIDSGRSFGSFQIQSNGSHTHTAYAPNHDTDSEFSQGYPNGNVHNAFRTSDRARDYGTYDGALSYTGDSSGNRARNIALLAFIKYQ